MLGLALAALPLALVATTPPQARSQAAPASESFRWHRLPDGPTLAGHAAVAHRYAQGTRLVAVGGMSGPTGGSTEAQALVLDGEQASWQAFRSSGAPRSRSGGPLRSGPSLALDPVENVALLRCDCADPAAYLLDLEEEAWSPLPGEAQSPLVSGLLAYDAARDRAVHAGGDLLGLGSLVSDTVAHDLSAERSGSMQLPPVPFELIYQAADIDPAKGQWFAFGGQGDDGGSSSDLWQAELSALDQPGAWRRVPAPADAPWPSRRTGASLTFLGDSGLALLFGGYDVERGERADAWLLDNRSPSRPTWILLGAEPDPEAGAPAARAGHVAAWDPVHQSVLLHGGVVVEGRDTRILGDTWRLQSPRDEEPSPTIFLPRLTNP